MGIVLGGFIVFVYLPMLVYNAIYLVIKEETKRNRRKKWY